CWQRSITNGAWLACSRRERRRQMSTPHDPSDGQPTHFSLADRERLLDEDSAAAARSELADSDDVVSEEAIAQAQHIDLRHHYGDRQPADGGRVGEQAALDTRADPDFDPGANPAEADLIDKTSGAPFQD